MLCDFTESDLQLLYHFFLILLFRTLRSRVPRAPPSGSEGFVSALFITTESSARIPPLASLDTM